MRWRCAILAMGLMLPAGPLPGLAQSTEAPEPYQLIRALQALQNDAAAGKAEARAAQPKLVAQIAAQFVKTPPEIFTERRNAEAAILFLFSGGPVASIRPMSGRIERAASPLLKGATAFAEGRESDARRLLLGMDALTQPVSLGGPLALVQAALIMHTEPDRAWDLLDKARLLSPGTQIEETALRRQVFIADEQGNAARFIKAAALYKRRFPTSIYGSAVTSRLAPAVTRLFPLFPKAGDDLLGLLDDEGGLAVLLSVARSALIDGQLALAVRLAEAASLRARPGSADAARAALYRATGVTLTAEGGHALRVVDRDLLGVEDRALLDAALSVEMQINAVPAVEASTGSLVEGGTVIAAKGALRNADALIEEAAR